MINKLIISIIQRDNEVWLVDLKFNSNSRELQKKTEDNEIQEYQKTSRVAEEISERYSKCKLDRIQKVCLRENKVLGVRWDTESDQDIINFESVASVATSNEPTMLE